MQQAETLPTSASEGPRKLPDWPGLWDYCPEADSEVTDIEGKIPKGLVGSLVRNGPGKRDLGSYFFDGDGLLRRVTFREDGSVHYRSRYVETPKYLAERSATEPQYRTAGTQLPGGPLKNMMKLPASEANTHVIAQGGRLLALFEGGPPFDVDPETLETRGMDHFGGQLKKGVPFSAHPHHDPNTGETYNFGVTAGRFAMIRAFKYDAAGTFSRVASIKLPFFTFLHDFGLSENWLTFPVPALRGNMLKMMSGFSSVFGSLETIPGRAAEFLLVSRDGKQQRRFEVAPFFPGHFIAAREEGDEVVVDLSCARQWEDMVPELSTFRTARFDYVGGQYCQRYRFNLNTGRVQSQELLPMPADFPRHDERIADHEVRYGYLACNPEAGMPGLFRGVLKVDLKTGARQLYDYGPGHQAQEPVFVPDPGANAEDAGWLVHFVHDASRRKTNVSILDARRVEAGPVATIKLPVNAGMTFHGSWVG